MRKYPHMNDSRMSTCLISTSTSYCWRSDVWLPLKRLPGRRRDEDVFGRNCSARQHDYDYRVGVQTLCAGNGNDSWLANSDTGSGALADSGEAWDARCSSPPSSVAVIGVGMSLLGPSMSVLAGLECAPGGDGDPCGGGVGCCIGTWGADSAWLSAVASPCGCSSLAETMRASSGGQVVRPAMLSCSTGETRASSGVGILHGVGWGSH